MWFLGTWMTNVVRVGKHRSYFAYRASTCFQTLGHSSVMLSVGRAFPHSLRQRQHFSPVLRPLTWLFPGALKGSESEEYPWEPRDNHWRDIDTGRAGAPPKGPQRVSGWTSPNPPILGFWFCSIRITMLEQKESLEISSFHFSDEKTEIYSSKLYGKRVADAEWELRFPDTWASCSLC